VVRRRLDAELVRRGLARDPGEARAAVLAGKVTVGGSIVTNEASLVAPGESVGLQGVERRFASRGGDKLDAALERFGIDPLGLDALDVGAATGGFTDCLLRRRAARVAAVDVGYGELAWLLRNDDRVTVLERTNVRDLRAGDLPFRPGIVVADLSFISLASVVPTLVAAAARRAIFVLLVKPQFEAPRSAVGPGGVVRDPEAWRAAVDAVADACEGQGADPLGVMASPVLGPAGNVEFFVHAERRAEPSGARASGMDAAIAQARLLAGVSA